MLSAEHVRHLISFGVTEGLLDSACVESFSDTRVRELGLGAKYPAEDLSGIYFPYYNGDTEHRRIGARVRVDTALTDKTRYLSEPGNRHLYVPPGGHAHFNDASVPLIFVESEKATLAVTAFAQRTNRKLLPIGVGGCWGWLRTQGNKLLAKGGTETETGPAPEINALELKQRVVFIAFDSNTASKAHVRNARKRFAKVLRKRGADVRYINIPENDNVNGPDDLIKVEGDDALARAIDEAFEPAGRATEITIREGEYPEALDEIEEIFAKQAARLGIFQRGPEIQRVIHLPEKRESSGLVRPKGTVLLEPVPEANLGEEFERIMWFKKFDSAGNPVRTNCPPILARRYLARRRWRIPALVGFISAPVMLRNGAILRTPGYDEASELFLTGAEKWPQIAEKPTLADAERALAELHEPFEEFPFRSPNDKAVAIAALVTALQRRTLGACPLFAYSAPASRSGKSLLAEAAAIISLGKPAAASAVSSDREELRKSLFAGLREGHAIVNLDNVEGKLQSPDLCKILTQDEFEDRLLGETARKSFPTNVLFTATGNNIVIQGDLVNRTLRCCIDAHMERPEQRIFKIDFKACLIANRTKLVIAILTILRAYHVAKEKEKPKQNVKPWGGFEDWMENVCAPLMWAGEPDPTLVRDTLVEEDPDKDAGAELLEQLSAFQQNDSGDENKDGFSVPEVVRAANEKLKGAHVHHELHDALLAATNVKETITPHGLGAWLKQWKGRIANKFELISLGRKHGGTRWKVKLSS